MEIQKSGRKPSLTLFEEFNDGSIKPIYVMEEFHQCFLEERDLTEYRTAIKMVGNWKEWERLKRDATTFRNLIIDWKDELEILLRSEALKKITDVVVSGKEQASLSAAKFIAQYGYNKAPVGRPSEELKKKEAKELAIRNTETAGDMERVMEVLSGGKK